MLDVLQENTESINNLNALMLTLCAARSVNGDVILVGMMPTFFCFAIKMNKFDGLLLTDLNLHFLFLAC